MKDKYENKCFISNETEEIYLVRVGDYNPHEEAFNVISEIYLTKLYFVNSHECLYMRGEELDFYKEIPENIYNIIECITKQALKDEDAIRKIISNNLFLNIKEKLTDCDK